MKKEVTKTDKDGNDKIMKISYKVKLIDSFRFLSSSLSSLVDNLSEGLHSDKCTGCKSCLDYMTTKNEQLITTNHNKSQQIMILSDGFKYLL